MVPQFGDVTRTEYDEVPDVPEHTEFDYSGCGCCVVLTLWIGGGFVTCVANYSVAGAVGTAIFLILLCVGYLLLALGFRRVVPATTKKVPRQVTENKLIAEHRCCIQCKHPIKALR
jgi:hypothetical protein